MSSDQTPSTFEDLAKESRALLKSSLASESLEPSPYLKTRVLARLREKQSEKKKISLWQWIATSSLMAFAVTAWIAFSFHQQAETDGIISQSYVIQVDFSHEDLSAIAHTEVLLPDDVHFVSSNPEVSRQKRLKLPIHLTGAGRGKLPFVVTSSTPGEKQIVVRMLNEKDELIREKTLKFQFAKQDSSFTL